MYVGESISLIVVTRIEIYIGLEWQDGTYVGGEGGTSGDAGWGEEEGRR